MSLLCFIVSYCTLFRDAVSSVYMYIIHVYIYIYIYTYAYLLRSHDTVHAMLQSAAMHQIVQHPHLNILHCIA